jgi:trimeric autotransporter adhesin
MSTKTLRKRIALVAVSALGFGLLSIAPSSAAQSDDLSLSSATSAVATDAEATTNLTLTYISNSVPANMVVTPVLISGPATNDLWAKDLSWTLATGTTDVNLTSVIKAVATGVVDYDTDLINKRTTAVRTVGFTPKVAGTYVFRFTASGAVNNQVVTWTVTATNPAVAASTAFLDTAIGSAVNADGAVLASPATTTGADTARARLTVRQYATAAAAAVAAAGGTMLADKWASAVTVAISGAGSVGLTSTTNERYSSVSIGATPSAVTTTAKDFYVFADGRTGTATITVSVGSTVVATKSFVFHGAAATITPTVVNSVIPASAAGASLGAITAVVTDANGNPVSGAVVRDVSSATTVISDSYDVCGTTGADGKVTCNLTGVAEGSANITLTTNASATATTGVTSAPVSIRVGSAPATATVTFDQSSYQPGARATITVALRDAAGLAVPNGTYAGIFTGVMTSTSVIAAGNLPGTALAAAGTEPGYAAGSIRTTGSTGNATFTINMPLVSGNVSVTGTGGTGLPTAAQVAIAGSAVVDPSVEVLAATDAATEAIDAANAATDAANAAAEAADAATAAAQDAADAVAALSTQVSEMIDALKKQITALTNLVIKIQKKVKA